MSETNEQFEALYQRFELNLIRRAHNALDELGLRFYNDSVGIRV